MGNPSCVFARQALSCNLIPTLSSSVLIRPRDGCTIDNSSAAGSRVRISYRISYQDVYIWTGIYGCLLCAISRCAVPYGGNPSCVCARQAFFCNLIPTLSSSVLVRPRDGCTIDNSSAAEPENVTCFRCLGRCSTPRTISCAGAMVRGGSWLAWSRVRERRDVFLLWRGLNLFFFMSLGPIVRKGGGRGGGGRPRETDHMVSAS